MAGCGCRESPRLVVVADAVSNALELVIAETLLNGVEGFVVRAGVETKDELDVAIGVDAASLADFTAVVRDLGVVTGDINVRNGGPFKSVRLFDKVVDVALKLGRCLFELCIAPLPDV